MRQIHTIRKTTIGGGKIVRTFFKPTRRTTEDSAFGRIIVLICNLSHCAYGLPVHKKRDKTQAIEASFDYLQRINEKALENDENLIAAFHSVLPGDKITLDEARVLYFHWMRLNRICRVYEYMRQGLISKKEALRVIDRYLPLLKSAESQMEQMLRRGYPIDFAEFMLKRLKGISSLEPINSNTSSML